MKGKEKANILVQKLQEANVGNIRRPMRTETLLLMDLDIGIIENEIRRDIQKRFPSTELRKLRKSKRNDRLGNPVNTARAEVPSTDAVNILR